MQIYSKQIVIILMIILSFSARGQVINSWSALGPYGKIQDITSSTTFRGNGRVTCIEFHPTDPNTLFIGTTGGIWKSTDDGASWTQLNTDLQLTPVESIHSLAVDQTNPNYIYATTGGPFALSTGVYRTMDGGTTWQRIVTGLPAKFNSPNYFTNFSGNVSTSCVKDANGTYITPCNGGYITKIIVCPFDVNTLYIGTDQGMYYTNNARSANPQWYSLTVPLTDIRYINFKPGSTSGSYTIYISGNDGVAVSTNLTTWTKLTGTLAGQLNINTDTDITANFTSVSTCNYHIDLSATTGDLFVLMTVEGTNGSSQRLYKIIYKYSSGVWTKVHSYNYTGNVYEVGAYHSPFVVDNANQANLYVGGGNVAVIRSTNWLTTSSYSTESCKAIHADHRYLKQSPFTGHLYSCNDGFLSKLNTTLSNTAITNCSAWFELANANLNISVVSNFSQSQDTPDHLLVGLYDDGLDRYWNGTWKSLFGGDGGGSMIFNDNLLYVASGGSFMKWIFSNGTYVSKKYLTPPPGIAFNRNGADDCLAFNNISNNRSFIYCSGTEVNKLAIGLPTDPASYTQLTSLGSLGVGWNTPVHIVQPAKSDSNTIYISVAPYYYDIGTQYRTRMFKTTNGGSSWIKLTPPVDDNLADFCIMDIAVSAVNKNKVFIAYSGVNTSYKVKVSNDGGSTWNDYHNSSSIIAPISGMVYEEGSNDGLYVSTAAGVYYTNNTMSNWISYSSNFPAVSINDIQITTKGNKIRASTSGRGMWEAYLYCSAPTNLNINSSYPGVVSGNIPLNTPYETGGTITASTVVQANSYNTFRSSQSIQFTAGFKATSTSNVKAYICPCAGPLPLLRVANDEESTVDIDSKVPNVEEKNIVPQDVLTYPNPTLGDFTMDMPENSEDVKELLIYNLQGEQITQFTLTKESPKRLKVVVANKNLSAGKYIIKVVTGNRIYNTSVEVISGTSDYPDIREKSKTTTKKKSKK